MGHALNITIQDILSRWKRMKGCKVLWLPGTDHAGIATQNVVERELSKEGFDRHKIGRDAFIERVWKWKAEYGGRIIHQLKRLGASCDWSRERFTLDEGLSRAVREVFVGLFEEGLIYRENRLINWCPRCHTALSDLEVEHEEIEGKLYFIRYPVWGGAGAVTGATTRPETMLGDAAVAVHPDDERYGPLAGRTLELPLTGRAIPVISDPAVDSAFGTGAVKVTPAHDFSDEVIGRRHNLPFVSVIGEDGIMSREAGERYAGLDRYQCRKKVLDDLRDLDLLDGERRHLHAVGHCYRCKTIIEPRLTVQWYVKIEPLAREAERAVKERAVQLIPESWENNYFAWMREIKDWCISRQIWWGHWIPVWYCPECPAAAGRTQGELIEHILIEPFGLPGGGTVQSGTYAYLRGLGLSHDQIINNSRAIKVPKEVKPLCSREDLRTCPSCGGGALIRDPDVLDTWFSSALWPFSTLGWPGSTEDLKTFYPTSVLVTGFDILFFWVARMIMMGMKVMGDVPFRDVYIHALVRDMKGQKMSKSKGNVIDPLFMIDKYGADAFRFTLAAFAAQGRDVRFSEDRVEGYRHFINKIWNATRFIVTYEQWRSEQDSAPPAELLGLSGQWILSRLAETVEAVNRHLTDYRFNDGASAVYQFVWHEFCDWYIELVKPVLYEGSEGEKKAVVDSLFHVLKNVLLLLHPFMPFVTEEIWSRLFGKGRSIMVSEYPEALERFPAAELRMQYLMDAVNGVRSIRGELNVAPSAELAVHIRTLSKDAEEVLRGNLTALVKLARCREVTLGPEVTRPRGSAVAVKDRMEIYLPLEGIIDVDREMQRLSKEKLKLDQSVVSLRRKLSNEEFLKGAPREIVEKDSMRLKELIEKVRKIGQSIAVLGTVAGGTEAP
jgi:valyl-tRNA synthetase